MRAGGEKTVVAVDIGGDKLIALSYDVRDGLLLQLAELVVRRGDGGSAYLDGLEEVADLARRKMLPVGISFAGPTDGTKLLAGPNLPVFIAELHDRYGGDFARLFPAVAVANDAEAGIMAGALEAAKRYPETRNVIYVINGSGLGGAVLTENMIFAAEPGHIPVEARLNPFGQQKPCGMLGATYVCVEIVAASKAGIEDIWLQQQGQRLSGREIAARYLAGDHMALDLYDNSALVTAHAIKGIAKAFGLPNDFDKQSLLATVASSKCRATASECAPSWRRIYPLPPGCCSRRTSALTPVSTAQPSPQQQAEILTRRNERSALVCALHRGGHGTLTSQRGPRRL